MEGIGGIAENDADALGRARAGVEETMSKSRRVYVLGLGADPPCLWGKDNGPCIYTFSSLQDARAVARPNDEDVFALVQVRKPKRRNQRGKGKRRKA